MVSGYVVPSIARHLAPPTKVERGRIFCYLLGCYKLRDSLIEIYRVETTFNWTMTTCMKASFLLCSPKPDNGGNKVMKLAYKEIPYEFGTKEKKTFG